MLQSTLSTYSGRQIGTFLLIKKPIVIGLVSLHRNRKNPKEISTTSISKDKDSLQPFLLVELNKFVIVLPFL